MTGDVLQRRGSSAEVNERLSFPSLNNTHTHSLHPFPFMCLSLMPCLPVVIVGGFVDN